MKIRDKTDFTVLTILYVMLLGFYTTFIVGIFKEAFLNVIIGAPVTQIFYEIILLIWTMAIPLVLIFLFDNLMTYKES